MKKLLATVSAVALAAGGTGAVGAFAAETAYKIVYGDADCDGDVKMNDVVLIMQCIANPGEYSLTTPGYANSDVSGRYDGITVSDALAIQRSLLEMGELPSGYKSMTGEEMEDRFSYMLMRWLSYYRVSKGQKELVHIPGGDTYGDIRAGELVSEFSSDKDRMNAALETSFEGEFYQDYSMFTELRGRDFLTETDMTGSEPIITEIDLDELARRNAQALVENEQTWGLLGSDMVAGAGTGAHYEESEGRMYYTVFLAAIIE
ncbi:MAG: dockerin type I repeat-containing protein [Ruminococcus sp.]|nr:dockerin type I repeat-containing protein [Ruminococcus sp.]